MRDEDLEAANWPSSGPRLKSGFQGVAEGGMQIFSEIPVSPLYVMVRDGRRGRSAGSTAAGSEAIGTCRWLMGWVLATLAASIRVRRVGMTPVMRSCDEYHFRPLPQKDAPRLGYLDGDEVARSEDVYHRALDGNETGGTPPSSIPGRRFPSVRAKVALITGVTGQDGAYLARLLLQNGYIVHGIKRRSSSFNTGRVDELYVDPHEGVTNFFMHYGDMTDSTSLIRLIQDIKPDGDLQPRGSKPRAGQLRNAGVHRECRCARNAASARGDPDLAPRGDRALLSGLDVGALRQGSGGSAKRDDALLPPLSLCGRQALRLLDHGQLP